MANRIRKERERLGWTQVQLAEKAGCTQQQLSRLEAGTRSLDENWLLQIAAALAVHPADLLDLPMAYPEPRDLAPDLVERRLLDFWRRLTPKQQDVAFALIDTWAGSEGSIGRHSQTA